MALGAASKKTNRVENSALSHHHAPMPHYDYETAHGGLVAGVDEVGRGPLAGPVIAAAVAFPSGVSETLGNMLDDSKKLTALARKRAWTLLWESDAYIAFGAASVAEIERLNILYASMAAMRKAILRLPELPDLVLVDGNRPPPSLPCEVKCLVGGDAISLSIAAASIVAKCLRDGLMARLDTRWPGYGWAKNAGYGTKAHCAALDRLGHTPHHRLGFAPVQAVLRRTVDFKRAGMDKRSGQ